jgi:hypothetical protein
LQPAARGYAALPPRQYCHAAAPLTLPPPPFIVCFDYADYFLFSCRWLLSLIRQDYYFASADTATLAFQPIDTLSDTRQILLLFPAFAIDDYFFAITQFDFAFH